MNEYQAMALNVFNHAHARMLLQSKGDRVDGEVGGRRTDRRRVMAEMPGCPLRASMMLGTRPTDDNSALTDSGCKEDPKSECHDLETVGGTWHANRKPCDDYWKACDV
jgi:hypothetical protein